MRVALRDAQHVVVDAHLAPVLLDALRDLLGQRHEHERAQQHELQHALAEVARRGAPSPARTPSGPRRGTWRAGTTNPVIDSVVASISMRWRLVSSPSAATAPATPPAMTRASAASGGSRSDVGGGREAAPACGPQPRSGTELFLHELDQRAERALRVHERDGRAPAPRAGRLVDHAVRRAPSPTRAPPRSRRRGTRRGAGPRPCSRGTSRPASRRVSA